MNTDLTTRVMLVGVTPGQSAAMQRAYATHMCEWLDAEDLDIATAHCHHQHIDLIILAVSDPQDPKVISFLQVYAGTLQLPLLVTGPEEEESALQELLKFGLHGYLLNDCIDEDICREVIHSTLQRAASRGKLQRFARDFSENHSRYLGIFRYAADPFMITDNEGAIRFVNTAAEHLLGFTSDQLEGNQPRLGRGVNDTAELALLNNDGQPCILELDFAAIHLAGAEAYLASLRDITAQKQAEERMRLNISDSWLSSAFLPEPAAQPPDQTTEQPVEATVGFVEQIVAHSAVEKQQQGQ